MSLPVSDLQFTIRVMKVKLPELKKRIQAIGGEIEELGNLGTRDYASFAFRKRGASRAMNKITKLLDEKLKKIQGGTMSSVEKVLEVIRLQAVALTPEDTGALKASSYVSVEQANKFIWGRVGYNITSGPVPGGVQTGVNYAVFVHETPIPHNIGQWKFFQTAVEGNQSQIGRMLKAEIKKGATEQALTAASIGGG